MECPKDLFYTKEHEWIKFDGEKATLGITDYAQDKLGDIVYVELPSEGEELKQGEALGVVESVKAVSDIYAAVSGTVVEVNTAITENPETLNEDCYEEGWLIRLKVADAQNAKNGLMNAEAYKAFLEEETA